MTRSGFDTHLHTVDNIFIRHKCFDQHSCGFVPNEDATVITATQYVFGRSYPKKLQTHEEIPTVFWSWYTPYQWGQYPWCNLLRYSIKLLNNDKMKEKKHFISGPVDIFKAMTMRTTNLILNWQFSHQQYSLNIPKPRKYIWFRHPLENSGVKVGFLKIYYLAIWIKTCIYVLYYY